MKEDLFIVGILDEYEVSHHDIRLDEIKRVFDSIHLNTFYYPFLEILEKSGKVKKGMCWFQ